MPNTEKKEVKSTSHYNLLKEFTTHTEEVFKKYCIEKYGKEVCRQYIFPYLDDMLECVSYHVEDLAEQSVQDEELSYDMQAEDYYAETEGENKNEY